MVLTKVKKAGRNYMKKNKNEEVAIQSASESDVGLPEYKIFKAR